MAYWSLELKGVAGLLPCAMPSLKMPFYKENILRGCLFFSATVDGSLKLLTAQDSGMDFHILQGKVLPKQYLKNWTPLLKTATFHDEKLRPWTQKFPSVKRS